MISSINAERDRAMDNLVDVVLNLRQPAKPLSAEAAKQLTRILCIANCNFDTAIQALIAEHLEITSDFTMIANYPRVMFDHPSFGKHLGDLAVRKKRDLRRSENDLERMGIEKVSPQEYTQFDPDIFSVESCQPTSTRRFDDTVCRLLTPAFRWMDQYGTEQKRRGSVVAYLYDASKEDQESQLDSVEPEHV